MKKKDILYLNKRHQVIVEDLLKDVKEAMYYATPSKVDGKYKDFLGILDSIYLHSNIFHDTTLKHENNDGVVAEFIFLIPNMLFYTSVGFLTGIKTDDNTDNIISHIEEVGGLCENATGELADILIDITETDELYNEIVELGKVEQN